MRRKHWGILILVVLVGLETYRQLPDSQTRQINGVIAVRAEARKIVLAQPGIKDVRWELDRAWLTAHAIEVPG